MSSILILSPGRCGSTWLFRLLAQHPHLAWPSRTTSRLPGGACWAALQRWPLRELRAPLPAALRPTPVEHYGALDAITGGRFTAPEPLPPHHLSDAQRSALRRWVQAHAACAGRPRTLLKLTGWPRLDLWRALLPQAAIVVILRDPRQAALSLSEAPWWLGEASWRWGPRSDDEQALLIRAGNHPQVLAALATARLHAAYVGLAGVHHVRYDDLLRAPSDTLRALYAALDLPQHQPRIDQRDAAPRPWSARVDPAIAQLFHAALAGCEHTAQAFSAPAPHRPGTS